MELKLLGRRNMNICWYIYEDENVLEMIAVISIGLSTLEGNHSCIFSLAQTNYQVPLEVTVTGQVGKSVIVKQMCDL